MGEEQKPDGAAQQERDKLLGEFLEERARRRWLRAAVIRIGGYIVAFFAGIGVVWDALAKLWAGIAKLMNG